MAPPQRASSPGRCATGPLVLVATALLVVVGVRAAIELPIDAVPDITNVQVQVITPAPALSPVEVEQYVTVPVERAMAGIPKVEEVRSISKYGLSVVTVVFDDGTDIYFARQLVLRAHARGRGGGARSPTASPRWGRSRPGLGEVYQFVRARRGALADGARGDARLVHRPAAPRRCPGIVEVNSFGGEDKQYQVVLDPKRLQAAGLSVAEVVRRARAVERQRRRRLHRAQPRAVRHRHGGPRARASTTSSRVVVGATPQGVPITVANVGDVRFGPRLRRGAATMDGKGEVVVGVALMLMGENSRTVTERREGASSRS